VTSATTNTTSSTTHNSDDAPCSVEIPMRCLTEN
jgi:hypothetical protein